MTSNWFSRRSSWSQQQEDAREPFDVDYARVVHSGSFRRLQGKTQILNLGDSDFYRTRLTHSLEVAQIAGGVMRQLAKSYSDHPAFPFLPPLSLIQTSGFCHDLGHPPFGHGGEVALNYCMRSHGGFEGNGQTLRILSRLENFSRDHGADLTRRTLLAVLKYPVPFAKALNPTLQPSLDATATSIRTLNRASCKPPKCYFEAENEVVEWILEPLPKDDRIEFQAFDLVTGKHSRPRHKSLDCSIMDLSDDIAYGVHDLEDAVALGLVDERNFREHVSEAASAPFLDALKKKYPDECGNDVYGCFVSKLFSDGNQRKRFIGRLVHHFVTNVELLTLDQFAEPLIRYRAQIKAPQRRFLDDLQDLIEQKVIFSPNVQQLEFKGQKLVVSVFEAIQSAPKSLLPSDAYARYVASDDEVRTICDYVAGMTDDFLLKTYDRLFSPRMGSVFDRL
ncbi:dGTPase [Bradyrhizobium sp. USDA 4524]|uniref:anti-phage deoxyguanosine triphosphatase n=1 Tax=unclassified Bradyrhizobium TaxID=2631580 RepID=UPI00209CB461|nr:MULTISPECIES: anti-phage deoxyguanosine triphosphatase [unclassified Bradyrhizobium]MCP1842131.1 dGTPase [Bradyrhizobium sp. USDA 4538]MCP1902695.1 dGTPase [Bradyrhizobium sp. USDA 4537]MCP1991648.1 dGTPase [Bradyrhizobium sp. USDA 4539]